jgi:CHAT domain-containing protein
MQHWEMGNTEAAFQLWKRTEQTLLRQNRLASTPTKVLYFNKMATYYQSRKNWKKSLEMLDEAALFQAKDPKYQDLTLQKRSHTLIQMGKETEGLACLQRAIDLSQELYPRQNLQTIGHYRQLGDYHEKKGRNEAALQAYQAALFHLCPDASWQSPIANLKAYQVQDRLTYLSILSSKAPLLGRMATEQQREELLEWAHQTYTEASRQIDSLQADYKRSGSKWRMAQVALPVYEGLIRIALDEFEATGNQQAFERALGFAEKNKAMVLREALQDLRAREFAGIPAEILSREKDLRLDLAFYRKKLFDEQQQAKADSLKLTLWQGRIFKLQTQFDKLLDTLERSYPAYFALKYGSTPLRLEPLLAAAKAAREQWVVYFWGEQSLFGLSLSERGPEAFSLDIDSSLIGDIRQLNSLLRTRPRDLSPGQRQESAQAYGQLAHRLFERLLAPCWAGPQQGSLRIIPDGLLHSLPFSALLTEEPATARNFGELPFLLRQQTVSYEYAIHFLTQEDKPRPVQAGWLGFAPSYGDSAQAWLPLRFNQREVQELRSKMGGEAWLGQEATEARFKAAASRHAMLHLAMHAFLNEENPLYSGMVFNLPADSLEDNLLHVYELYNLPLQAELVVLSACNSGAGKLVGGEGVLSLARAFRYAGCPSTIMSLWTADDRSSLKLMNYTYDQLEQDLPKDQALHQAKLSYLQSSPRAHPYYWAGYVFAGDNGKLQWTPGFSLSYLLGGLLLLLILSGWFWWKKRKLI